MQRQRDRDRDRMSHYWEDRERDSRRSRSRSRSRERRRGWDDTGDYEQQHHHLQPPPPRQHFAGAGLGNSAFELYVGGFRPGQVTEVMLAELFSQILGQCAGFSAAGGPPVTAVRLCGGGTYARVEFRDDELCETALQFNTMVLNDRQLKINRPSEWTALRGVGEPTVAPLRAPDELLRKLRVDPALTAAVTGAVNADARKLVVSNLAPTVTSQMLRDLFTAALQTLPGEGGSGSQVVSAEVEASGASAIVEFRDETLADYALQLFNSMELCGKPMQITRPAVVPPPAAVVAAAPPPAAPAAAPTPTRVLCLENLLNAATLADDAEFAECVEEIRAEVASFGAVAEFALPRRAGDFARAPDAAATCFVKYELVSSAVKAHAALHAREFDGNVVRASFLRPEVLGW